LPKPELGDANLVDVALTYNEEEKVATGEIELPEPGAGAGYWGQPYFENAVYSRYYRPGAQIPIVGPPAERIPAVLAYKPKFDTSRVVTLATSSDLSEHEEGEGEGKESRVLLRLGLKVNEITKNPSQTDTVQAARLQLKFDELEMPRFEVGRNGQEIDLLSKGDLRLLNTFVKQTSAVALVNKLGLIYKSNINVLNINNPQFRFIVPLLTSNVVDSLESVSISMPDPDKDSKGEVQPGQAWKYTRERQVSFQDRVVYQRRPDDQGNPNAAPPQLPPPRVYRFQEEYTYKYIGTRERAGKKEAVVEVTGKAMRAPGGKHDVHGQIKGTVLVELDTGVLVDVNLEREFEVDTSERGIKKSASGLYHYRITRSPSN
jgi:hypothetical protein